MGAKSLTPDKSLEASGNLQHEQQAATTMVAVLAMQSRDNSFNLGVVSKSWRAGVTDALGRVVENVNACLGGAKLSTRNIDQDRTALKKIQDALNEVQAD